MSATAGDGKSRSSRDHPDKYRTKLIGEAAKRARDGAIARLDASESGRLPGVKEEVLSRLDQDARGSVDKFAGLLIDQIVAKDAERRLLRRKIDNQQLRAIAFLASTIIYATLLLVAAIGSPPGGIFPETGWRHDLAVQTNWLLFTTAVLGVWALATRLRRGPRERRIPESKKLDRDFLQLCANADRKLADEWVRPISDGVLDDRKDPRSATILRVVDASKFIGMQPVPIETEAFKLLAELLAGSPQASIGICGPRGAGKSTLIHYFCRTSEGSQEESVEGGSRKTTARNRRVIGILVDVPVAYDQRDFLAYTYSRLLQEVDEKVVKPSWQPRTLLEWQFFSELAKRARPQAPDLEGDHSGDVRSYVESGRLHLSDDVATSSSLSGGLTIPWGASLTRSGGRQVTRGRLSYQDLVEKFKEFVRVLDKAGLQIRIGIDELDKLDPDDARSFLNGLKSILGLPGTQFLISVSEDAMSDFERRGVPVRDAFDSSLDEVIRIEEMSIEDSMRLLSSRGNYDFPETFGALCHCMSGGLPRELLRIARQLVRDNARQDPRDPAAYGQLKPLCERLIGNDLTAKSEALRVVVRSIDAEPYAMRFRSWLANSSEDQKPSEERQETSDKLPISSDELLSACQEYLDYPVEVPGLAEAPELTIALGRLSALALELAGYRYFAATILDFFASGDGQRRSEDEEKRHKSLEILSTARVRFADDPRLAWSLVTRSRQHQGIGPDLAMPAEGRRLPPGHRPPASGT
jgi:KAP family P-loop domain